MSRQDLVAIVDQSENFLILQHYLIDSGIAAKLSDSKALIVYLVLKRYARWSGPRSCFPSIPTIARLSFCGTRTVYNALETLVRFDPQLVKIEKVTYKGLKERGLLPAGYRASGVEINLYTILPIAPSLQFPEAPQAESVEKKPEPEKGVSEAEVYKGDLIGAWRKGKQKLLGEDAKVTSAEAKQIRQDLFGEFSSLVSKERLLTEITRFWLPKKDMTDLERECVEKDRSVGALRWMIRRKLSEEAEHRAQHNEHDAKTARNDKARELAKRIVEEYDLPLKIENWVAEQLRMNAPVFGPIRLTNWLDKACPLKESDDVEYLAKKKLEAWGRKRFEALKEKRLNELKETDKELWARLIAGRTPPDSIRAIAKGTQPAPALFREACTYLVENNLISDQPQGAGGGEK